MSEVGGEVPEVPEVPDKLIAEVKPVNDSRNQLLLNKAEISNIVDEPLVPACEAFYDLNVQTLSSSASFENLQIEGGAANVIIDYRSLSEENRRIVDLMITEGHGIMLPDYDGRLAVKFEFPIDATSTAHQVKVVSIDLASKFVKQEMTWAPKYTQKQIAGIYMSPEVNKMDPMELAKQTGWFYSLEEGIFYESEEHYIKTHEMVE